MKEIITIRVSEYLSNDLAVKIAKAAWHSDAPAAINRVRQSVFDDKIVNDCFGVIATTADQEIVGRLHCIQSELDRALWYYGDLFVTAAFRRMRVATQMVKAAIDHLSDRGAQRLRCYVEPQNVPSMQLQRSLGFSEKPFEQFNDLNNDGEIMFEYNLPNQLTVIPATADEAYFVRIMFAQNKNNLQCENISLPQWRELLAADDPNAADFLICKGAMPVAYMKLIGSPIDNRAELDMLFVAEKYHRQGIGRYAVRYAEEYARYKGFSKLSIPIVGDNTLAEHLCISCGYTGIYHPEIQKRVYCKELK